MLRRGHCGQHSFIGSLTTGSPGVSAAPRNTHNGVINGFSGANVMVLLSPSPLGAKLANTSQWVSSTGAKDKGRQAQGSASF